MFDAGDFSNLPTLFRVALAQVKRHDHPRFDLSTHLSTHLSGDLSASANDLSGDLPGGFQTTAMIELEAAPSRSEQCPPLAHFSALNQFREDFGQSITDGFPALRSRVPCIQCFGLLR